MQRPRRVRSAVLAAASSSLQPWQEAFARHRYLILQSVLTDPLLAVAHQYALKRARYSREADDHQVPGAPAFYADPLMETLLELGTSVVRGFTGVEPLPTYSYLRVYGRGTLLNPHIDRPACEISLTLSLGYDGESPWPLYLAAPDGVQTVLLPPGDALLYRGSECAHWRGELAGEYHAQVFLHYVDAAGPHARWRYDKRPAVGVRRGPFPVVAAKSR
jgi:hypothetical protein